MNKEKLLNVYTGIKKEIDNLAIGNVIDFGCGSYQDSIQNVFVERDFDNDMGKVFYINDYPMTKIKEIIAVVYRSIIDTVTEFEFNTSYLKG